MALTADDLRIAVRSCTTALTPLADRDWSVRAADTDYTCRRMLDHLVDCMLFYAASLATHASGPVGDIRDGSPNDASITELLVAFGGAGAILAAVIEGAPRHVRAYHPAGSADVEGWAAMGCDEVLVHTHDLVVSLGGHADVPDALAARIVARLFPWAPAGFGGFETLLWCNGRRALGPHDRLDPDWSWQCAPLAEWDGTVRKWRPRSRRV